MRRKLTNSEIKKLSPPEERDMFVWDTEEKGFGLRVTPTGKMTFVVQYRLRGNRRTYRLTIGPYGRWTPTEAREEARRILRERDRGQDPLAARWRQSQTVTVVMNAFIEKHHRDKKDNRSIEQVRRALQRYVVPAWDDRPFAEIERRDINKLLDQLMARGTPIMANRLHANLRTLFRWAVKQDIIANDPMVGVDRPAPPVGRSRVLNDGELAEVWVAADSLGSPFGRFIQLLILTAQRRSEVAEMRWSEVNLERATWSLPAERTKNKREHAVPLVPELVEILQGFPSRQRQDASDLVFTTNWRTPIKGFSVAKRKLDEQILVARRQAANKRDDAVEPMPNWTFHDLRRTATTGMQRLGIKPYVAERILNHDQGSPGDLCAL
jgi:integrase